MSCAEPVSTRHLTTHTLAQQLETAPLMNRVDTKYLVSLRQLSEIVQSLKTGYSILETNTLRWFAYDTLYYDTPNRQLYLAHHNGKLNRYKVRTRHYRDAGLTFLEVKHKNNQRRTIKHRIPVELNGHSVRNPQVGDFLSQTAGLSVAGMLPSLFVGYHRATLLHQGGEERVTIDVDLHFACPNSGKWVNLSTLALIEAKVSARQTTSPLLEILKSMAIRPVGFSKYCIGSALLYGDALKTNRFKPVLRKLAQATSQYEHPSSVIHRCKERTWNSPLTAISSLA